MVLFVFSYISKEILTIREAVWLTDNTYKYEDLVRMMGEVVSVLEGKIRVSTTNVPPVEKSVSILSNIYDDFNKKITRPNSVIKLHKKVETAAGGLCLFLPLAVALLPSGFLSVCR